MKIGIQVSCNLEKRTGIEEYIYQLLKHLPMVDDYKNHHFFIYTPETPMLHRDWGQSQKILKWPFKFGWTQLRLSWELLKSKPDILFVPAHTFPLIHPNLVITIQGLEYETVPENYSFWERKILRYLTKKNLKKAEKIIVPSKCTKRDLVELYKVNPKKIFVIPHGISEQQTAKNEQSIHCSLPTGPYLLYLGSGHERKNIDGLRKTFKILKEKHKILHKLILAGVEKHIGQNEKWELLRNADVFVFPSFYEGFGFPALEAQAVGIPVVASNLSSLPEILGDSALLVDPSRPEEIAEAIYNIIKNPDLKRELIRKGYENVKRFSWEKCARETLSIILNS